MYDVQKRRKKAAKTIRILQDYLGDLADLTLLDIGCSTGFMTQVYSEHFAQVTGIDIDESAIHFATHQNTARNLNFWVQDAMETPFESERFDVITCTQIYEHVPDSQRLMDGIFRLLKTGGVCYLTAANRLRWLEPHYHLPLLSVMPKSLAHHYLKRCRGIDCYYETLLTLWGLKTLVRKFEIIDYTLKVIADPKRFHADDLLPENPRAYALIKSLSRLLYPLIPTYIWVLKKSNDPAPSRN